MSGENKRPDLRIEKRYGAESDVVLCSGVIVGFRNRDGSMRAVVDDPDIQAALDEWAPRLARHRDLVAHANAERRFRARRALGVGVFADDEKPMRFTVPAPDDDVPRVNEPRLGADSSIVAFALFCAVALVSLLMWLVS